jgi:hypothetical protein
MNDFEVNQSRPPGFLVVNDIRRRRVPMRRRKVSLFSLEFDCGFSMSSLFMSYKHEFPFF